MYLILNLVLISACVNWGGSSAFGMYIFIYALVFSYIFLQVDCFKWALIYHIEQQRVYSVLWQFQWGDHLPLVYLSLYIYWYFLIFPYKLTVLNGLSLTLCKCINVTFSSSNFKWGEDISLWYLYLYIYILVFSYKLTVLNGFSLTVCKCIAVTFLSSSFEWGGG